MITKDSSSAMSFLDLNLGSDLNYIANEIEIIKSRTTSKARTNQNQKKIDETVDTNALSSAGTTKEELDALAALDSVDKLFDTSQDDDAARALSSSSSSALSLM